MLLKAVPRLEDNEADDKTDPWCAYNLSIYMFCSIFLDTAGSMDHYHVLRQAIFFKEFLATVVALFWQTGKGGKWQVNWCPRNS